MPKVVDKEQRKSEIALMAMEVFGRKGFEKATIQEIAEQGGIGKGTIYQYFSTKEEILNEISRMMFTEMERSLGAALLKSTDPIEKIEAIVRTSLGVAPPFEPVFIIYMELWRLGLTSGRYSEFMETFKNFLNNFAKTIAEIVEDGKRKGVFIQDVDSEGLAMSFFAALDGMYMYSMFFQGGFDLQAAADAFLKNFFRGLMT